MIIKQKKKNENEEKHRIIFLIIFIFSIIIIYFSYNNSSLTIRPFIPFKSKSILILFDIKLYFILIILTYNFGNIYQALILFYSILIPNYIHFLSSLFYMNFNQDIFYKYFFYIFFFFILGQVIFTKENRIINRILAFLYAILLLILFALLANYQAIENNSFILGNKIISGFVLAFSCYYFIFYILNINHNNYLQLYNFVENINNNLLVVLLFVLIIPSIFLKNDKFVSIILYFICLLIPLCGIKYELKITFNSNKRNWINFNFAFDEENNINNVNNLNMNNLLSKIKITKSIKWNKTLILYHILRLIFFILMFALISFFSNKIDKEESSIAFLFLSFSIFLFILSKILMQWLEIINMTFFHLDSDSFNYN